MPRIIFLNRYFYPDHSATSQILSDLAFDLAGRGYEACVVTSRQRYDAPQAQLPQRETIRGVEVHRLPTTRFGRSAILGRGLDYVSFHAAMIGAVRALARRGDVLVAKTDPPLLCVPALHVARRRSLHLVNWLQDLYPEVAVRLGVPMMRGPAAAVLGRLRDAALRAAAANVAVGYRMGENVLGRGVAPERLHVIPNWCDDEDIRPVAPAKNPLRREWGLADRFVVGYAGNLGRAHEFETVLAAAERLRADARIVFLLVGGGHRFDELAARVAARGLDRAFRFVPYQDRSRLAVSLGVPDVHWISLKPELEGLVFPSKLYGIAAAGRPVIAITAPDGEIARLVRAHDCGFVVAPGDGPALADTLTRAAADPERLAAMGTRARAMLDAQFSRRAALEKWRAVLDGIGQGRVASSE
jgi:glycosyltransferase involved in cell wall biosynthesis